MHPKLDESQIERLRSVANEIINLIETKGDAASLVEAFNKETGRTLQLDDFHTAVESRSIDGFVRSTLMPRPVRVPDITRKELIDLVAHIGSAQHAEHEVEYLIDLIQANVPHPAVADLIFWTNLAPEEVVDQALSYRPLLTPPP